MKVAILGMGAIGSYVSAKLSLLKDVELFLLARSNFEEISADGIVLTEAEFSEKEPVIYNQFSVMRRMEEMPKCDVVIICVKSSQTSSILENIETLCHTGTEIITLQNGLNFEDEIAHSVPADNAVYSGTCWIKASVLSKNHVRHDFGTLIKLGQYSGKTSDISNIVTLFQTAGLVIELTDNICAVQLTKLALNVPFFVLSAMTGKSVAEILFDPIVDKKRSTLQSEIIQVSASIGSPVDEPFIEKIIVDLRAMQPVPPASRKGVMSRMKAELPQSSGALLRFFKNRGIALPQLNEAYNATLKL
jgi:2-dehydropantoate 2-reductase